MLDLILPQIRCVAETDFVRTFEIDFDPTAETYQALITASEFLNEHLFDGRLLSALLTLRNRGREYGHFAGDRFEKLEGGQKRNEIALNARYFGSCSIEEILSTLAHEMCHQAQHDFPEIYGPSGKRGYHTARFAAEMEKIGLITSNTGKPGGKRTGYAMSDYIMEGGRFEEVCRNLLSSGFTIPYAEQQARRLVSTAGVGFVEKSPRKAKYFCPLCDLKVWGKPNLHVTCGDHQTRLQVSMP